MWIKLLNFHKFLWVDDKPRNHDSIIERFSGRDVILDRVTSKKDALLKLSMEDYFRIISDINRGNSPEERLTLLRTKSEQFLPNTNGNLFIIQIIGRVLARS